MRGRAAGDHACGRGPSDGLAGGRRSVSRRGGVRGHPGSGRAGDSARRGEEDPAADHGHAAVGAGEDARRSRCTAAGLASARRADAADAPATANSRAHVAAHPVQPRSGRRVQTGARTCRRPVFPAQSGALSGSPAGGPAVARAGRRAGAARAALVRTHAQPAASALRHRSAPRRSKTPPRRRARKPVHPQHVARSGSVPARGRAPGLRSEHDPRHGSLAQYRVRFVAPLHGGRHRRNPVLPPQARTLALLSPERAQGRSAGARPGSLPQPYRDG